MLLILAVTMAIGAPIAVCLALGGVVYLFVTGQISMISILAPRVYAGINTFELLAVPMFILSGDIMYQGKVSKSLVELARVMVGRIRGGLALVTTLACMFFGAVSGSGPATSSAIGSIVAPDMEAEGYPPAFTAGVIAACGPLGVLIPPSIMMVVYGGVTSTSVGKLLLGGVGPGVLFGVLMMIYSWWACGKRGFGGTGKVVTGFKAFVKALKNAGWALMTPIIILGGIYSGIFTPTEAASVSVLYSLILVLFVYKSVKVKDLVKLFVTSAETTGGVMIVVGAVGIFGWVITRERIPQMLIQAALSSNTSVLSFFIIINIALLIAGMFMSGSAAIILLAPFFVPIVNMLKLDPVFIGALVVANLCIGQCTPPVALSLFVAARITKAKMGEAIREVIPYCIVQVVGLVILMLCPAIITWLPHILMD